MKYEIKGGGFPEFYSVLYGTGYPSSKFIRYTVFTFWGAKRVIRKHKRKMQCGQINPNANPYDIVYVEEALTPSDVEIRIKQLERELGIGS